MRGGHARGGEDTGPMEIRNGRRSGRRAEKMERGGEDR